MSNPVWHRFRVLAPFLWWVAFIPEGRGQSPLPGTINAWTNPTSGFWEDMRWSLGGLPSSGESIVISNKGWKAVGITPATARNFPGTLQPQSVDVESPPNSRNLLLLNYSGFRTPLSVQQLTVGTNARVLALASALQVSSVLSVGGTFDQAEFSMVSAGTLQLGDVGPGSYNLTNGTLLVTDSGKIGGMFPGYFNQFGGTNFAHTIQLFSGEYDLYDGTLATSDIVYRTGYGAIGFNQYGGVVKPDSLHATSGGYVLAGGNFACPQVLLPGVTSNRDVANSAGFLQTGGTNQSGWIDIGNYRPPFANASAFGNYTLSNGVLITSTVSIGPYGSFAQWGGSHTSTGISLGGDTVYFGAPGYASYALSGGNLSVGNLALSLAYFSQGGGTNRVAGELRLGSPGLYGSSYNLGAGLLVTSNTTVTTSSYSGSGFTQTGGTHFVSNLLTVSEGVPADPNSLVSRGYMLSGGSLVAPKIRVEAGATFFHFGGGLVNTDSLTLAYGTWQASTNDQQFGRLALGISQGKTSTVALPASPVVLSFLDSRSTSWSNGAMLVITGWRGSPAGGGRHQVYFGQDGGGLNPAQQAQVFFQAPAGSPGLYPAALLPTGEVVPGNFLLARHTEGGLEFSWAPGAVLQTSVNVLGPYQDIGGVFGSYSVHSDEPQRFFRLRAPSAAPSLVSNLPP